MKLIITENRQGGANLLSDHLAQAIAGNPHIVLGLSTGFTSLLAYQSLVIRHHEKGGFSFNNLTAFSTDEYVGLPPHDHRSTRFMMNYHLFRQVDIKRENTFVPRGDAPDLDAECKAYDLLIQARGGLGLVVLGLGHNGHVGLNEPGSIAKSRTRLVDLTPSTIAAISGGERFKSFTDAPPQAISMGMAQILNARKILLIATGVGKADAIKRMFEGKVTPGVPASFLTAHPELTVITDTDAVSKLDPAVIRSLT